MSNGTFNGIVLGDHVSLSIDTSTEVEVHKIPRADGAIIRPKGGSLKNIIVTGWFIGKTRSEVEQLFNVMAANLTSQLGDLIINNETYSNCLLVSISQGGGHNKWSNFTINFIKSG